MQKLKILLKIKLFFIFLFVPFISFAANDLSFSADTNLSLLTADTSASTEVAVASGGLLDNIDIQSNYIDFTFQNAGSFVISTVNPGQYLKLVKNSGGDDYSLSPTCPTNTVTVSGTGTVTVLRLQVYTTDQCTTTPPSGGGGGGGGGGYVSTVPVFYTLSINGGLAESLSSDVVLSLSAQNANEMMISNLSNFAGAVWESYSSIKAWTLAAGEGYRSVYVKLRNPQGESSIMTATIQVLSQSQEDFGGTGVVGSYSAYMALGQSLTINMDKGLSLNPDALCQSGALIKLPSDNDPNTQMDSTVYYCGSNGKRYVFPNPAVYFTWYDDFSTVSVVDPSLLARIPLGGNVTSRPGARMVKFTTDAKTYAVAKNGVLRWVQDELTAMALYGVNWNKKIDDISDAFFLDYRMGDPIALADIVPGSMPVEEPIEPVTPVTPVEPVQPSELTCSSSVYFVEFSELGDNHAEILPLQELLQCLGYFPEDIDPNGYFGPTTEASVKAFQAAKGIDPLGYVGPGTRAALNEYYLAQ